MPILSKQGEVRPLNIVDGQEFDAIYNGSTSILNNGMDRENLPDKSIPFDKFEDYAFHQYYQSYVKMEESRITEYDETIPTTTVDGLIYDNYVGGFEYNEFYGAAHVVDTLQPVPSALEKIAMELEKFNNNN